MTPTHSPAQTCTAAQSYRPRARSPWNYPFHNVLNPIAAAILSGNAIVVEAAGEDVPTASGSRLWLAGLWSTPAHAGALGSQSNFGLLAD